MPGLAARSRSLTRLLAAGWCLGLVAFASAEEPTGLDQLPAPAGRKIDFRSDVQPIFARHCYDCHGAEAQEGGLRLHQKQAALAGGDTGTAFEPGKSAESRLVQYITGLNDDGVLMPPEGVGERVTAEEVSVLRAWIDQGAPWPDDADLDEPQSRHWAFQPVVEPPLPNVKNAGWVRNGIDSFVLARLEGLEIEPSPEADRATLIRRLSLDLLGLPPSPDEVDRFLADEEEGAYERLVERLLASPHYGERWGRHWLDSARYADSDGYEKDTPRPHAWRWRDWVIDALNRDLPFDQFTIQQLAGDLLPGATLEQKIATGFHRNTLTNKEGGVDQEEFRVKAVVDRVNTTGTVWLGLTVGCAQCHSHKYDPISQQEYYRLFAFFNSADEVNIPAAAAEDVEAYRKAKAAFDSEQARLKAALEAYEKETLPIRLAEWEKTAGELPDELQAIIRIAPADRTAEQKAALLEHYRKLDAELVRLESAVAEHAKKAPVDPGTKLQAQTLAETRPPRPTHVLIRGDFLRKGAEVEPAVPAVLPPLEASDGSPDRFDLARWLVDARNPLTSRVTVNRVWQRYFGRGLVATSEDFGTQGERPSHPELLDWLASQFTKSGWSLKALHRLIVSSATYRQSSAFRLELVETDPQNVYLARQSRQRVEAEIVRDLALAASGLLHPAIGGPSVRPPQPPGISELTYANSVKWVESTGPNRYRRGMYTHFQRTSPYPMLTTFDAPDSNVCTVRRERSNTPLQALVLLNDVVFVECAQALGCRAIREVPRCKRGAPPIRERVRHIFRLCLAREPTSAESERLETLYQELDELCRANPDEAARLAGSMENGADPVEAAVWTGLARAVLNLDGFVTRE